MLNQFSVCLCCYEGRSKSSRTSTEAQSFKSKQECHTFWLTLLLRETSFLYRKLLPVHVISRLLFDVTFCPQNPSSHIPFDVKSRIPEHVLCKNVHGNRIGVQMKQIRGLAQNLNILSCKQVENSDYSQFQSRFRYPCLGASLSWQRIVLEFYIECFNQRDFGPVSQEKYRVLLNF